MVKKLKTTFDQWMADPEIKEYFDKGYKDLILSEIILALKKNDRKSVLELAKEVVLQTDTTQNNEALCWLSGQNYEQVKKLKESLCF